MAVILRDFVGLSKGTVDYHICYKESHRCTARRGGARFGRLTP